ncbi:protein of unknown function [Aminobacter niigataensis]|nr:protein of unknown function [Aminobacter niigataensis]
MGRPGSDDAGNKKRSKQAHLALSFESTFEGNVAGRRLQPACEDALHFRQWLNLWASVLSPSRMRARDRGIQLEAMTWRN